MTSTTALRGAGEMFEFHFYGLENSDGKPYVFSGGTFDFLEVVCRIAEVYTPQLAGNFVSALLDEKVKELSHLRVVAFEFDYQWEERNPDEDYSWDFPPKLKRIHLVKQI
jgi:hypothetical protein